jgi:hypothetical protein
MKNIEEQNRLELHEGCYKVGCKHVKNTRRMQDAQITKQIEEC